MDRCELHLVRQLEDVSHTTRRESKNGWSHIVQADASFLNLVLDCDECVFHADRNANKHNVRILGTKNPPN